ncbi:MAG: DUF3108 domain-containing protein [bacterium]
MNSYLKRLSGLLLLLVASPLFAEPHPLLTPYSAEYLITRDGKTVGNSFFRLGISADGQYRFEVFTVPTEKYAGARRSKEVFETSVGNISGGIPVPATYYYSIGKKPNIESWQYRFDWKEQKLHASSGRETASMPLSDNTQDRLSYLMLAALLTQPQEPLKIHFPLADLATNQVVTLKREKQSTIKTTAGEFIATEIQRLDDRDQVRHLWITEEPPRLPVLIEFKNREGLLRMELTSLQSG